MKRAIMLSALICLVGCARVGGYRESYLREIWVPTAVSDRERTEFEKVIWLKSPPPDKPYKVIGMVTLPSHYSITEQINIGRAAGSIYGANAVLVEQHTQEGFSMSKAGAFISAGYNQVTTIVKAIVWE